MLELAKECKNFDVFTHVSTAYVNCNRTGFVKEQIYFDSSEDPERIVNKIMSMPKDEATSKEKDIIGLFPNTYTFTKNLSEKSLVTNQEHVRVVICRPSIIASAFKDPIPGWTDSMSAAGGLTILGGFGLKHLAFLPNQPGLFDMVPVDLVTNSILITCCHGSTLEPNSHIVFHCNSSYRRPIDIYQYVKHCEKNYDHIKLDKNQGLVWGQYFSSKRVYETLAFLDERLPLKALDLVGRVTKNSKYQNVAKIGNLMYDKIQEQMDSYQFFIQGDWEYETMVVYDLLKFMPKEQRDEFNIEIYSLDWSRYVYKYISGLCVWGLKEQKISPEFELEQVLSVNQWAYWNLEKAYNAFKQSQLALVPSLAQKSMFLTLNSILYKLVEGVFVGWNGFEELLAKKSTKKYVIVLMNEPQNLDMLILFYINYTRLRSPGSFYHSGSLQGDLMRQCQFEWVPKDKKMDKGMLEKFLNCICSDRVTFVSSTLLQNLEEGVHMLLDQELNDVELVPISIYKDTTEQTFETVTSYRDLFLQARNLTQHHFGKVFIKFHSPIKMTDVNQLRTTDFVYQPITLAQVVQAAISTLNNQKPTS